MKFGCSAWIFVLLSVIVCLSAVGCSEEHVHTEAVDAAVAATCTESGKTEGKHCSVCNEVLVAQEDVAALGHTEAVDAAIAATCTAVGKTEGKHCSVCNAVLVAQTDVAALGHTEVIDAAVAATCTAAGKTEGKHCSVCNTVLVAQEDVAALGHTEVIDAAVAATCTDAGKTEGKHCSVCNTVLVAQAEVAALGHTEVIDAAVAPTCTEAGKTEGKHCSVCNTVLVAQTDVAALRHTEVIDAAVAATTAKTGLTEGKHCSVCNTVLVAQQTVAKKTTAELCKLHGTQGDHTCILKGATLSSWNNYGKFTDPQYKQVMNYRVYLPRNYDPAKKYPMVIYMHGKGGESMNISEIGINSVLSQSITQCKAEVICVIPQCLPNCYWPVNPYTVDVVFRLFEDIQKHLSVDKNRIYVTGHSYGAMGTLLLLQKHPNYFAASMITAGAAASYSNYNSIAKTPLRMFCGDQDEYRFYNNMLPLYNKLKSLGADVEYTVWKGKDHGVFSYSAQNSSVVKWLLEQRLDD